MEELPTRLKRTLEVVYALEGVAGAKVWQWDGKVAVGIRPSAAHATPELLTRVARAVEMLREPGETWEFGLLEEDV
jgi:hypothetical protein